MVWPPHTWRHRRVSPNPPSPRGGQHTCPQGPLGRAHRVQNQLHKARGPARLGYTGLHHRGPAPQARRACASKHELVARPCERPPWLAHSPVGRPIGWRGTRSCTTGRYKRWPRQSPVVASAAHGVARAPAGGPAPAAAQTPRGVAGGSLPERHTPLYSPEAFQDRGVDQPQDVVDAAEHLESAPARRVLREQRACLWHQWQRALRPHHQRPRCRWPWARPKVHKMPQRPQERGPSPSRGLQ